MPKDRPESFTARYKGKTIVFRRYMSDHDGAHGYSFECGAGKHGGIIHIDTDSGKRHSLTFDAEGRPTIQASILCRTPTKADPKKECGWHVFVEKGVIRDA